MATSPAAYTPSAFVRSHWSTTMPLSTPRPAAAAIADAGSTPIPTTTTSAVSTRPSSSTTLSTQLPPRAEGRLGVQGRIYRMRITDGELRVEQERTLGRLAEGLKRLRSARGLSQSDVARLAGVSPSAISQAEAGRRGLGLDTVVTLAESTGIGVDELLGTSPDPGYALARRERVAPRRGSTALLDDPSLGVRAFLVELGAGERGEPPVPHRGPELLVVAAGLVQIDLGTETPVMRAGDAVLATRVGVRGWRNLLAAQARLFWIPRDPLPREI